MGGSLAARRAIAPAAILLALVLVGCSTTGASGGAGGSSVSANGKTLTIYASAPAGLGDPTVQRDVLDAEQLAFGQAQKTVTAVGLRLVTLTDPKISDDARKAISDTSAIAYLGETQPGASADSLGITNALDLLQVSPSDTALELTQASPAIPGSPDRYYEDLGDYGHTFAREVPTTAQEAGALVSAMSGAGSVYVAQDGSEYGRALAGAFTRAAAGKLSISASGAGAKAILLAMTDVDRAAAAAQAAPSAQPYAADALYGAALAARLPRVLAVAPGFLKPDAGFAGLFLTHYGHRPDPRAIFGYEAMLAVLDTLAKTGSQVNNRTTVVHDFFAIKNRRSVLGTYSIDQNGDTDLAPFVLARVKGGSLVPFKSLGP